MYFWINSSFDTGSAYEPIFEYPIQVTKSEEVKDGASAYEPSVDYPTEEVKDGMLLQLKVINDHVYVQKSKTRKDNHILEAGLGMS